MRFELMLSGFADRLLTIWIQRRSGEVETRTRTFTVQE